MAVAAGGLAFWRTYHVQAWLTDLGLYFDCAYRISMGEVPYKDFFIVTAPLTYGVLAACLKLFGQFYLVSRIYVAVQCGLLVALTFLFGERVLKLNRTQCLMLAVFQTIWSPQMMSGVMWYDNDSTFCGLLAGLALLRAWSRPDQPLRWSVLGGASCALAFWFKQDSGAGIIAGGLLAATLRVLGGDRQARRHWLAFVAGITAVFSAVGFYFIAHGAFRDMVFWTMQRAIRFKLTSPELADMSLSLEQIPSRWGALSLLLSPFTTPIDRSSRFVLAIYFLAPAGAWYRFRISRDRSESALAGVALMWAISFYAGLCTHAGQGYTNKVATFAPIMGMLWRPWPPGSPALLRGRFAAAAFALGLALVGLRGAYYLGNNSSSGLETVPLQSRRLAGLPVSARLKSLDRLIDYIDRNVPPQEDFLIFDYIIVYFAVQRKNPHPVTDPNAMRLGDEPVILERLGRRPDIRWFFHLGGPEDFAKELAFGQAKEIQPHRLRAYVKEHFRFLESRDGFTVWVRKDGPPGKS